jgi:hypothetical protein
MFMLRCLLVICALLMGCSSFNKVPRDIASIHPKKIEGSSNSLFLIEPGLEEWSIRILNTCSWSKGSLDPPVSKYQFDLRRENGEVLFGQLLGNEIYLGNGISKSIMTCHVEDSVANEFRAMYER